MLTPKLFAEQWPDGRRQLPGDDPLLGRLPKSDREFLTDCGLPSDQKLGLVFDLATGLGITTCGRHEYLRIGDDGEADICVSPSTGEVWTIHPDTQRFVNSSVPQLAEFMLLVRNGKLSFTNAGEQDRIRFQELMRTLNIVDPAALGVATNWWSERVADWARELY